MKLTGYDAIRFSEATGAALKKYEDPTEDAWDECTPEQARRVAHEDPSLIYCETGTLLDDPSAVAWGDGSYLVGA